MLTIYFQYPWPRKGTHYKHLQSQPENRRMRQSKHNRAKKSFAKNPAEHLDAEAPVSQARQAASWGRRPRARRPSTARGRNKCYNPACSSSGACRSYPVKIQESPPRELKPVYIIQCGPEQVGVLGGGSHSFETP